MWDEGYELSWVGDWSGRRARLTPRRLALYDATEDRRFTYRELDERATRVGAFLTDALGLSRGDVVALISRNRVEPIDLYFATGKLGMILAPLNHRLAPLELDGLIARMRPRALFYEETFRPLVEQLSLPESVRAVISFGSPDSPYEKDALRMPLRQVNRPKRLGDVHLYVHTGGTTGVPKICRITYRQMLWNSINLIVSGAGRSGIEQKELLTFPLYHIGGWNTVTPVFHLGGQVVVIREFDPDLVLELIERERITHFGGVEAMFRRIISSPRFAQTDLSSLEYVSSAGAPCSADVMRPFWERGIPMTQSYGLTEAGPSNFVFVPAGHTWEEIREKQASVGSPMFHCDYKIVDPRTHEPVPRGEVGEIWFRGPHTFDGYVDDPERTRRVSDDGGWIRSGDLVREDEDGFVYIVGRVDDMYISGGENIAPGEVEEVLRQHPAVEDVAVVGVPDEQWGEVGLAALVLKSGMSCTVEELKRFCEGRMARFKIPKHFVFLTAIPLTGPGKVDRRTLRERFLSGELMGEG